MLSSKYEFKAIYENNDGIYIVEAMNVQQAHSTAANSPYPGVKTKLVRLEDWQEKTVWTEKDGFIEFGS